MEDISLMLKSVRRHIQLVVAVAATIALAGCGYTGRPSKPAPREAIRMRAFTIPATPGRPV
jgi:hypothetical protein